MKWSKYFNESYNFDTMSLIYKSNIFMMHSLLEVLYIKKSKNSHFYGCILILPWYSICMLQRDKHCFYFAAVAILTTVIFQQIAHKPTKFKKEFAAYIGEMYPVGLCQHILSDASLHVCKWFLVGPVSECLGAFVF